MASSYLKFVTSTSSGAGVKIFRLVSKKCELVYFGVKIMNFVVFGVKKSRIRVFLVSAENGAGVNKKTNITYHTIILVDLKDRRESILLLCISQICAKT